jgi:DNA mismatch endonuclease (patch repair protein)
VPLSRSEQMARIRGANTAPEVGLARELDRRGVVYARDLKLATGSRPDILLEGQRVAVFLDGCFWHGCPDHYVRPRTRHEFWATKLRLNVERDRRHTTALEQGDWHVLRFWEHEVASDVGAVADRIEAAANGDRRPEPRWVVVSVSPLSGDLEERRLQLFSDPSVNRIEVGPRNSRSGKPRNR